MSITETTPLVGIIPTNETTTPPPEWSPPTIAGGIEETFLLFGQPENTSGREIGTLNDGRRINWVAYREAIRDLYRQPYTGAVPAEEFSLRIHAIDAQFGLEPIEPTPDGDVEDAPPSILGGGIAAGGLDALGTLAASSPALARKAAGVLLTAAFILSACSPPTPPPEQPPVTEPPGITQQAESNTPIPPPTAPPTPEATATTPPQEFACWVPGEPNEVNHLAWDDTIEEQMAALVAEEESCLSDWGITAENIAPLFIATGRVEYNYTLGYAPYPYLSIGFGRRGDYNSLPSFIITSVNKVTMPSGSENWVLGLATRREGSDKLGKFHLMIDRAAMEYLAAGAFKNYVYPEELSDEAMLAFLNSDRLQSGFTIAPFIAGPGLDKVLTDNPEPWSDSILLIKNQFIDGKGFVLKDTGEAIGTGFNVWALAASVNPRRNTAEFDKAYLAWAETKIFPVLIFAPVAKAP